MRQWMKGVLGGAAVLGAATLVAPAVRAGGEAPKAEPQKRIEIVRTIGGGGAYLGVRIDDTTGSDRGAIVKKVEADTPAAKAGLKDGDVITRYDGEAVRSAMQLARLVRETPAGRVVPIDVLRGGLKQTLQATLTENKSGHFFNRELPAIADLMPPMLPEAPEAPEAPMPPMPPRMRFHFDDEGGGGRSFLWDRAFERGPRKLGIRYQEIEGQLAKYFKLAGDEGILVAEVEDEGPAAKAGMKAGDVILKFGSASISDSSQMRRAVADAEAGSEVTIQVQREGRTLDLKVKLAGEKDKERRPAAGETS
jgi:serine protease Do